MQVGSWYQSQIARLQPEKVTTGNLAIGTRVRVLGCLSHQSHHVGRYGTVVHNFHDRSNNQLFSVTVRLESGSCCLASRVEPICS